MSDRPVSLIGIASLDPTNQIPSVNVEDIGDEAAAATASSMATSMMLSSISILTDEVDGIGRGAAHGVNPKLKAIRGELKKNPELNST